LTLKLQRLHEPHGASLRENLSETYEKMNIPISFKLIYVLQVTWQSKSMILQLLSLQEHPEWGGGGGCWAAATTKSKFKKHKFCRHYDIKCFTWFTIQLKLATEMSWWLVH
jgi:hypothetical protein